MKSDPARLPRAAGIARDAGAAVMAVYGRPGAVARKEDRSPLTEADRASHALIASRLAALEVDGAPLPVLSEEGRAVPYAVRAAWRRFWLVDPLDGTKEFLKHNGEFTVNIALIEDGRPVLGVVYAPALDVLYTGAAGEGAFRRAGAGPDERLPLAARPARFTVVASRSHMDADTAACIEAFRARHGAVEQRSIGSSLKLCLVAEGAAQAYPRYAPTMEWDTAAAQAVVEAAGGRVLARGTSDPVRYNKPDLHNPPFLVLGAGVEPV